MKTHDKLYQATLEWLEERGINIEDIAELAFNLQKPYVLELTKEDASESVNAVLKKREVQNAILTGIFLDKAAENGYPEEPLLSQLVNDNSLFGIDEVLALSVVNIYGFIGLTNFGYLDKEKPGIIKELNNNNKVNTFLDDLIAAIAAAAASRIAHKTKDNGNPNIDNDNFL